jgi:hypothetical protein
VLEATNGEVYAGQAVDVTRRYVQHLKTHVDIRRLFFKRVARPDLTGFERQVIRSLETGGLKTRNITDASIVLGERDFDVVMLPEAQARFERDLSFNDDAGDRTNDVSLRRKLDRRYAQFLRRPHAQVVVEILREYVRQCIPAFVRSELSFWALSLPPSPPYIYSRAIVGWQEVVTAYEEDDGSCWFTFHVAGSPLELNQMTTIEGALSRLETLEVQEHTYKPGGSDQVKLIVGADEVPTLLQDVSFQRAARKMNLLLMRKNTTPSRIFHCFALADHVMGERMPAAIPGSPAPDARAT